MLMPGMSSLRRLLVVAMGVLGALALPLARAAEGSAAASAATQPLDFSGSISGDRLLPDRGSGPVDRARLEFLNRGSSMGGVLQGSGEFTAPLARPQGLDGRTPDRSRGRINFEEVWFQSGRAAGSGLSTEDFERAAGLRRSGSNAAGDDSENLPVPPSTTPLRGFGAGDRGSLDPADRRLDSPAEYDLRRSLDPVLEMGVEDLGRIRSNVRSGAGLVAGGLAESDPRSSVRSDLLAPLRGGTSVETSTAPRSLRDFIDNPQRLESLGSAGLGLDRDTTRDELIPYVPRSRQDFQYSSGDSRLGIGAYGSTPGVRGRNGLGSQGSRVGTSSLSPALVLPVPESVVVPPRRTSEAQFPSRRF